MTKRPLTCLIADDHPAVVDAVARYLDHHGIAVVDRANDGSDALAKIESHSPSIALIDLNMPHVNGLELAPMFRDDPELHSTCLIALTAYGDEKYRRLTRSAGFHAHVVKPADVALLQSIIKQFDD